MAITGVPDEGREVQLTAKAREHGKDEIIYPEHYLNHCLCRVCQLSSPYISSFNRQAPRHWLCFSSFIKMVPGCIRNSLIVFTCFIHEMLFSELCNIVHLLPVSLRPSILRSESLGWFLLLIIIILFIIIIYADGHMKMCYSLKWYSN